MRSDQVHVLRALRSPSAVSRAVTVLEHELGVEPFTRHGRGNERNRYGAAFLASSLTARRALDAAVQGVRELAGVDSGSISVGFLHSLGATTVPAMLRRHHERHPRTRFALHQGSGRRLLTDMVVASGHRRAGCTEVDFDEIADERFVVLERGHTLRRILDDACARRGRIAAIAFEGTDVTTLRGLTGVGLGVGVLPRISGVTPGPGGGVVEIALRDPDLIRPIALGWVEGRYLAPAVEAFCDSVTSCPPGLLTDSA